MLYVVLGGGLCLTSHTAIFNPVSLQCFILAVHVAPHVTNSFSPQYSPSGCLVASRVPLDPEALTGSPGPASYGT